MVDSQQIGIGSTLGGFKIEKELGRGGMGVVYKAHELSLNRKIALKLLSQRLSNDEEFIKRFKREARVVAALSHPNIVNILSYGEEQGLYYFAMEYVRGTDLGEIMKERKEIPLDEALAITIQVADALGEAAARGVVHRDLKPSNIMIDSAGRVKVTDFGIAYFQDAEAQLTRTGLYMGTPEYSSPEQARGATLDARSDIFSLGAVLYKMLTGEAAVSGESPLAVVAKILTEPVTPIKQVKSDLPQSVCDLVDKMMAKEIDARFQSPAELVSAIRNCLDNLEMEAPLAKTQLTQMRAVPPPIPPKSSRAKTFGMVAGIILAILLSMWTVDALFNKGGDDEVLVSEADNGALTTGSENTEEAQVAGSAGEASRPIVQEPEEVPLEQGNSPATMVEENLPSEPAVKTAKLPPPPLPEVPVVLVLVSGDETLVPAVRIHLESIIVNSGLKAFSTAEIPVLTRKMQMGDVPFSWHDVQQFVPPGKADILLLAEVQKTGSMPLTYYGRTQTLTSASFSVRAVDMATGVSAASPTSGSMKFTPLNMDAEVQKGVHSAADTLGEQLKSYWLEKRKTSGGRSG
ncbi:MAG: serine/threonine protein kinase [Desulfobulbaceae bacterium]|nr:serine/threonine protein kinase [Desulfobulbaceae bacterium]